jgi:uncharacterized protein YjbI with pentapeptide repeats
LSPILLVFPCPAHADIFQWEYINPADPSQGKRQSTTLAPDGAGVDAVPGANLAGRNLTMAYLIGANLSSFFSFGPELAGTNLSRADLTAANLTRATLTDADFTDAEVRGASLSKGYLCLFSCSPELKGTGITLAQLYSTASYKAHDLTRVGLGFHNLNGGNFAGQNLTNAGFFGARLTDADFTGAQVTGASFGREFRPVTFIGTGITLAQLYSTASYQAHDLIGIDFTGNDLAGANFSGQNLTNALFFDAWLTDADFRDANLSNAMLTTYYGVPSRVPVPNLTNADFSRANLTNADFFAATLTNANFTAADARGAHFYLIPADAITNNLIRPDGHLNGLDLNTGGLLVVRDYDGNSNNRVYPYDPIPPIPITVDQHLSMGPGGTLRMVFEADAWDSTISFAPGIPVTLGGTLELTFADDVTLASQVGRTFDLFDWTGVSPTGEFAISSPYAWDLSNLYTTGEVTLTAIPEPATFALVALGLLSLVARVRRSQLNEESHAETRRCGGVGVEHASLRPQRLCVNLLSIVVFAWPAQADIFQWEYINPADPSQGKRQSTTLAPDGAGVDAVPGANLAGRNLTMAYLIEADLTGAYGPYANLANADLSQTNLTNAWFGAATLTDADFTGAVVQGASFVETTSRGFMASQLYSTASYQAHDLTGILLSSNNLSGWNFAEQNLTSAYFDSATLAGTDFTGALVKGAAFGSATSSGFMASQLYSTASYQAHDLTGIILGLNDLSGWNFAGQNLSNASFNSTTLTGTDFTGALVTGAAFGDVTSRGFTASQLYSMASYQAHDLTGTLLYFNDLSGWNFAGQNLNNAYFNSTTLTGTDFTGALVKGTAFGDATSRGFTASQLYSTASYKAHDLAGINLRDNDLTGWNFAGQNLTNADFSRATLTNADFAGAEIQGASFNRDYFIDPPTGTGITLAQLYSTASYQAKDLSGIGLSYNNLAGGNFARQNLKYANFGLATLSGTNFRDANLTNAGFAVFRFGNPAYFEYADLTDADLTAADARGAFGLELSGLSGATTANLIWSNGHIRGLDLHADGLLVVRDYDGRQYDTSIRIPITVDQQLAVGPGGTLRMVFEADAWDSTISFAPSIPVALGGTLELTFAADVNLASQVGRTFDLFDWTGVTPTGAFAVSSPYAWDLSQLYTTGEVTLTAVPEPASIALAVASVIGLAVSRWRGAELVWIAAWRRQLIARGESPWSTNPRRSKPHRGDSWHRVPRTFRPVGAQSRHEFCSRG